MTLYLRLADGVFGLTAATVQAAVPEISFVEGSDLTDWGYAPYAEAAQPTLEPGQGSVEVAPIDGAQQWAVLDGPIERRLIAKSVVQERVNTIGKLGAVLAVLNSQPIYFARWFAPDWPNVYFDDEGLLAVLTAVGCSAEEIAAVTAP